MRNILKYAGIAILVIIFLSGGVAFGMTIAALQGTPDFDPERMSSALPSEIRDRNGNLIVRLDREQYRVETDLDDVPEHTQQAFIAIEDDNFYDHRGFDPRGIMRAATTNFRTTGNPFRGPQGGSTITQQLVKHAFLSPKQQLERKIQELWLAIQVERVYTKDEILEFYLNNAVYFNHNAYGIQAGSQVYFDKDVSELTVEESALLAGVIKHPSRLSPFNNPEDAKQRQELVLRSMKSQDFITKDEYKTAKSVGIDDMLTELPERTYPNPHFVDYVINEEVIPILTEITGGSSEEARGQAENLLYHGGLTIYTTMDKSMQQTAENVVNDSNNYPTTREDASGVTQPQSAVVLADPESGELRALVGGRNYGINNMVNRTLSRRQPGSVMKPINIYAPAIEERIISPGSVLDDAPMVFDIPDTNRTYTPENFNRSFAGLVTARTALVRSLNVPAVDLYVNELGANKAAEYTEQFGITTMTESDKRNPAAAIGGWDHGVKPIEVNAAFATLANEGVRVEPYAVREIQDRNGDIIYEAVPEKKPVLSEETAWLVSDMLKDTVNWGTASQVNLGRPAAAKTGTSQNQRDGWLSTYTPNLAMTVWIGYDRHDAQGSSISNPWRYTTSMVNQIMGPSLEGMEIRNFQRPSGIQGPISISTKSGLLPSDITPDDYITSDYFLNNMVPTQEDNAFEEVEICLESEQLATEDCPEHTLETKVFLKDRSYMTTDDRWTGGPGRVPADTELMAPEESCEIHGDGEEGVSPGLRGDVIHDGRAIRLRWSSLREDIAGYNLYKQGPQDDEFVLIKENTANTFFVDNDISEGETYTYRLTEIDEEGNESTFAQTVTISVVTDDTSTEQEDQVEDETPPDQEQENNQDTDDPEEDEETETKENEHEPEEEENGHSTDPTDDLENGNNQND